MPGPSAHPQIDGVAKRAGAGAVGLVLATALGIALRLVGLDLLVVILVLAVAAIGLAGISLTAFGSLWSGVPALIVMVVPPFAAAIVIDVPLIGPIVEVPVAAAPAARWAAGYRFADATLRADLAGTFTTERAGRHGSTFYDTFTAAPVVGTGWWPGDLVAVWAIAEGGRPAEWSRPGGLVRVLADEKHAEVIDRVMRRHRLGSVPDRVIGRWTADPAAARGEAWLLLALILGGACAAWAVLCVLVRPPHPGQARASRRPGRGRDG